MSPAMERQRWLADALRAAEYFLRTGKAFVRPATPEEKLLAAIFGSAK